MPEHTNTCFSTIFIASESMSYHEKSLETQKTTFSTEAFGETSPTYRLQFFTTVSKSKGIKTNEKFTYSFVT